MAANNLRAFLNTIKEKEQIFGKLSPINTIDEMKWTWEDKTFAEGMQNTGTADFSIFDDLKYYIQEINLPPISIVSGDNLDSPLQTSSTAKSIFGQSQTFDITFLETTNPICEKIFIRWIQHIRNPSWSGTDMPYMIADITITLKEKNVKYYLYGCKPTSVESIKLSQRDGATTRRVTFSVDFVWAEIAPKENSGYPEATDAQVEQLDQDIRNSAKQPETRNGWQ